MLWGKRGDLMQEEANQKTVGIAVQGGKMTGRLFLRAVEKYLHYRHEQKQYKKRDPTNYEMNKPKKVRIKKLVKEGTGVSSVELKDNHRTLTVTDQLCCHKLASLC